MDGIKPIRRLGERVDDLSQLRHLRTESVAGPLCRLWCGEDDTRVALAPAAVVEGNDEIASLGEGHGILAQQRRRAAPAMGHDDGWELLLGSRREDFRRHSRAFTPNRRLAEADPVWNRIWRRLLRRGCAGQGEQRQHH